MMSVAPETSLLPKRSSNRAGKLNTLIEGLVVATLAFAPLAFGVVQAWSEQVVLCAVAGLVGLLFLKLLLVRGSRLTWSWAFIPMMAFMLLVWAQQAEWPRGMVEKLAPRNVSLRSELLADLPSDVSAPAHVAASIYPEGTRHDLRLLLACAAVFLVAVNVFKDARRIKRLLAAITIIGAIICLLALAQHATGTDKIYGLFPTTAAARPDGGPFINHSHFSQFMNLSIGAALGLLLIQLSETKPESRRRSGWDTTSKSGASHIGSLPRSIWLLATFIVLAFVSVALSMSRGGVLSGAASMIITGVLLVLGKRRRASPLSTALPLLGLAAFALVLWITFDSLYVRFAAAEAEHLGGRLQILQDLRRLWPEFRIFGTGQGTFEYAFPLVDTSTFPVRAVHAENEYAQLLTETGTLGLAAFVAFLAVITFAFIRCLRREKSAPIMAAAYGLGFGLAAILIHSWSDFGQHMPANALLTSTLCALLLGISRWRSEPTERSPAKGPSAPAGLQRVASIAGTGAVLLMLLASLVQANRVRLAEDQWDAAMAASDEFKAREAVGTNEQYTRLLWHAQRAVELQPGNISYRYGLNLHRWRSISRVLDGQGRVLLSPSAVGHTRRIIAELHAARPACPTFGSLYALVGQLELFVLNDTAGVPHIQTGYRLSPTDPTACFVAGELAARQGAWDDSLKAMKRASALDSSLNARATALFLEAHQPMLALALAGDDAFALLGLAEMLEREPSGPKAAANTTNPVSAGPTTSLAVANARETAKAARTRAEAILQAECARDNASSQALVAMAGIYRSRRQHDSAVQFYRRALTVDYRQAGWRLELIKTLEEAGGIAQAIKEAEILIRQRPADLEAKQLLQRLTDEVDQKQRPSSQ